MSSHLVVTSEEESYVTVAQFLSTLLDEGQARTVLADTPGSLFLKDAEELIAEGSFEALSDLFLGKINLLCSEAADSDIETVLDFCTHLVQQLPEQSLGKYIKKFAQQLAAKDDDHPEQRLSAIVQLFNVTPDHRLQFELLLDAITYARTAGLYNLLSPSVRMWLDSWIEEWQLNATDKKTLLFASAELFRAQKKRKASQKAYDLTVRALAMMQDSSAEEIAEVKPLAVGVVAEFLRSPDSFQFDLLHSPTISQLEADASHEPLFQLLTLVLRGDAKGLHSFLENHPEVAEASGTTEQQLETKTRLMALLALTNSAQRVTFADIQERLGLAAGDEVEEWLVRAMGKKLIEGQMDQVQQQVTITRSTFATFEPQHWQLLEKQLAAWKVSVQNVKSMMQLSEPELAIKPAANGVRV